jgi:hypothetical protein
MKTKFKSTIRVVCYSFTGAVMLIAFSARAQNLFEMDNGGNINEFTPGAVQSTYSYQIS